MEKENKKVRDEARKEYNETVRVCASPSYSVCTDQLSPRVRQSLAMFVRKRDPRYKSHLAHQAGVNQTKANNSSSPSGPKPTSRTPQANNTSYVEQEWQKVARDHQHDDLEWAAAGGEDPEEWECVACGKSFKSEAAWDSHERSKKHMKEVERLKREIMKENEELGLSSKGWDDGDEGARIVEMDENAAPQPPQTPPEQGGEDSDAVSVPLSETIDALEDEFVSEVSSKDKVRVACNDEGLGIQPPVSAPASRELSKREKRKLREARKAQTGATEESTAQVTYFVCCKSCPDRWLGLQCLQKNF